MLSSSAGCAMCENRLVCLLFSGADSALLLQGVCHRDLKLENTLLDGRPAPRLKICDFGYSKVCCCLHSILILQLVV